jgi:hypothetical protein
LHIEFVAFPGERNGFSPDGHYAVVDVRELDEGGAIGGMDVGGLNGLGGEDLRRGVIGAALKNEERTAGGGGKAHLHPPVADTARKTEDGVMGIHGEIRSIGVALKEETDEAAVGAIQLADIEAAVAVPLDPRRRGGPLRRQIDRLAPG